jgi:hypothetical protein
LKINQNQNFSNFNAGVPFWLVVYSCFSCLEQRVSVKRFVSLQFLNLRHWGGLPERVISPSQDRYLTQTYIHALSVIRIRDPCVRGSKESSCLRPRDHCHRFYLTESAQIRSTKLNALVCELRGLLEDVNNLMAGYQVMLFRNTSKI